MHVVVFPILFFLGVGAQKILFLNENEKCREGSEPWHCKRSNSCKSLKTLIRKNELQLCGFTGKVPVICCPDKTLVDKYPQKVGLKAKEKCKEYAQYVYRKIENPILVPGAEPFKINNECVRTVETLIVGGTEAKLKEFPHMALIGIKNGTEIEWYCGGSLISERFVLTAAHCLLSNHFNQAVVRLGDLNIKSKKDRARPKDFKIAAVFDHPGYVFPKAYHDISLLKLDHDVPLSPNIRPLCLHTEETIKNKEAIASGWGLTAAGGNASDTLLYVKLGLVKNEDCRKFYLLDRNKLPHGTSAKTMICAGDEEGKDTCQGDSGGPLQITLKEPYCMFAQIGITSFGPKCGIKVAGGYTRVSYYVPWIESIVWP